MWTADKERTQCRIDHSQIATAEFLGLHQEEHERSAVKDGHSVDDPPECWVRAHEDAVAKLHHGIEQEACRCHIDTLTSKTLSTLLKWRVGTELWGARGKLAPAPAPSSRPAGMSPISRKRLLATE